MSVLKVADLGRAAQRVTRLWEMVDNGRDEKTQKVAAKTYISSTKSSITHFGN